MTSRTPLAVHPCKSSYDFGWANFCPISRKFLSIRPFNLYSMSSVRPLVCPSVRPSIAVGQQLMAGLHWSSSARQSLAVRQKDLSEQYRLILKRQNRVENGQNLYNFLTFFYSFFYFSFLLSIFFLFFPFSSLFFCLQCTTESDCTTKWAFM